MKARVLIVHNGYLQRGGEDSVVADEFAMLIAKGHDVIHYQRHNQEITELGNISLAAQTVWSRRTEADIAKVIKDFCPDVIHVHNTFPLISPSIYWQIFALNIPVVQTLHNFRLLCPQATFLRNGKICEDCLGRVPWRGVMRACYRDSLAQTSVLAGMVVAHRVLGTWRHKISRYIALNEFCKQKFIEGGLPAERILIKPNFSDFATPIVDERDGFLFVGRLASEKGVGILADATSKLDGAKLKVVGDGPEAGCFNGVKGVTCVGILAKEAVQLEMTKSIALVLPSICYEQSPRTLVEAYACGLPVIASRLGALTELVSDGQTGLLFDPGSSDDLAAKMKWASTNPAAMKEMGCKARSEYEAKYTSEINYKQLVGVYKEAINDTSTRRNK